MLNKINFSLIQADNQFFLWKSEQSRERFVLARVSVDCLVKTV